MTSVFVVFGSTGEYDDYVAYTVRAFATKAEADAFEELCEAHLRAYGCDKDSCFTTETRPYAKGADVEECMETSPDPHCRVSYTGSSYFVKEVPFGAAPEKATA